MNDFNLLEDEGIKRSIAEFEVYIQMRCKSFGNFALRDGNRFAHAAAQYIAEFPGIRFNPFFLHGIKAGEVNHLLQAMANSFREQKRHGRVEHVHARRFVNRFLDCKNADALLFEDIHLLTMEEQHAFLQVFEKLNVTRKQIVITADRAPKQLRVDLGFIDKLCSRIESGLVIELR